MGTAMDVVEVAVALTNGERVLVVADDKDAARLWTRCVADALPDGVGLVRNRIGETVETQNGGRVYVCTPRQTMTVRGLLVDHVVIDAENVPQKMRDALGPVTRA